MKPYTHKIFMPRVDEFVKKHKAATEVNYKWDVWR